VTPAKTRKEFSLPSTKATTGLLDELTGAPASAAAPRPVQPAPAAPAAAPPAERPARQAAPEAPAADTERGGKPARVPIRVQVPEELADRVRAAVAHLAWQEENWSSLNAATAAALEQFVKAAEQEHNNGEPFPWTPGRQLPAGRRVGR
jgi:hypothetical protein